jgi:hypothetical protein
VPKLERNANAAMLKFVALRLFVTAHTRSFVLPVPYAY